MNTEDTSISEQPTTKPVIVIHGGAGWSQNTRDEIKDAIQAGLKTALDAGFSILEFLIAISQGLAPLILTSISPSNF